MLISVFKKIFMKIFLRRGPAGGNTKNTVSYSDPVNPEAIKQRERRSSRRQVRKKQHPHANGFRKNSWPLKNDVFSTLTISNGITQVKRRKKMGNFSYKGKNYEVDSIDFLTRFENWDENFAEGMAPHLKTYPRD